MASAPQFLGPDGVLRETFVFSTTLQNRFFTGVADPATVDMQVQIRGGGFSSDPDLIFFEGTSFTIPNPAAFPDGLQLFPGSNLIEVLSVLTNGDSTAVSTIDANLSLERDLGAQEDSPTGIFIERLDRTVQISVDDIEDENLQGFHFYASTEAGGGVVGYNRVNPSLVIAGETLEIPSTIGELEVDAIVAKNADGTPQADPLFVAVQGTQQDFAEEVLQTDFNERVEVPETADRVRTTVTVETIETTRRFSFIHNRNATFNDAVNPAIPNASFNTILSEDPLYYVATAVYLINGVEVESELSPEVAGAPLIVTTNIGVFPTVGRQQIVRDFTLAIHRSQPQIQIHPGTTLRDTVVDPFSSEAARIRFILDFAHIAQSFTTLLQIDDPGFTGESIPVAQSSFKLALKNAFFLESFEATQNVIDNAFERLASNYGITRRGGLRARGEVIFFLDSAPDTSVLLAIGQELAAGSISFRTTSPANIDAGGAGAFFNPATGRYSTTAFVQASSPGSDGNVAPGQIQVVVGGIAGLSVTNASRTFGGTDEESNRDLAVRAMTAIASVDSGTAQGYTKTSTGVPAVQQVSIVDAGHVLMARDYEPLLDRHLGGMVDIWIRGTQEARVTDNFVFAFEIARDVQFEPVGAPEDLVFRVIDDRVTDDSPIIEMIDLPDQGLGLENATKGYFFDLTDVEIQQPDVIRLSTAANDPVDIAITDVISGSFRFRTTNRYVFTRQPVSSVSRLEGAVSGVIDSGSYSLFHPSSPLIQGRSAEAGDYIQIEQPLDDTSIPSGDPIEVTDEEHVLLDGIEYVDNLGANQLTVRVWNLLRTIEYRGPFHPDVGTGSSVQFTIIEGDAHTPLGIQVVPVASPTDDDLKVGDSVLVDYFHDENFVVEYNTNGLVRVVQDEVNRMRHITADVLVKDAIPVAVDISATIILLPGYNVSDVDSNVRTDLTNLFDAQVLGEPMRQSDIVRVIEEALGVSYLIVPLTKMVKSDGAQVVREPIPTNQATDWVLLTEWSTSSVDTYLLTTPLESATTDGGGPVNEFRAVFDEQDQLGLQVQAPSFNGTPLRNSVGNAFIIGNQGLNIPGYSDDDTLKDPDTGQPFATDEQIEEERRNITADRILITVTKGTTPEAATITVTYIVGGDTGTKNIEVGPIEYLILGDLETVYDEDEDFATRLSSRAAGRAK